MAMRIGELGRITETSVETIRFYEREGLLPAPARSDGNYRLYSDDHIEQLRFIRHCRSLDIALDEIRSLLQHRDEPEEDCTDVNNLLDQHIRAVEVRMKELRQLKAHLVNLRRQCKTTSSTSSCGILRALSDNSCHDTAVHQ